MQRAITLFALLGLGALLLSLNGCGGGGSSQANQGSPASTPLSATAAFSAAKYQPSTPLQIRIAVTPASSTAFYAVEDTPPPGWTVSNIDHDGTYDASNNEVKWLFSDNTTTPSSLTYTVTPPSGASDAQTFTGTASFDGNNVAVGGKRTISQ